MRNRINGPEGFAFVKEFLTPIELRFLRSEITAQYESVMPYGACPPINLYHIGAPSDHAERWPKAARILPADAASVIQELPFFRRLRREFGSAVVTREDGSSHAECYWRLVRPDCPEDVGPLHADRWFWNLSDVIIPKGYERVKVWLPIWTNAGRNGLLLRPGSHREVWQYEVIEREGKRKPKLVDRFRPDGTGSCVTELIPAAPGDLIVFNDGLIHGGAMNLADETRISLEFTLLVPRML